MKQGCEPRQPADTSGDGRWLSMHNRFVEEAQSYSEAKRPDGFNMDVLFLGDSIVQQLQFTKLYSNFIKDGKLSCANFGIGGDRVEHVLWRVIDGHLFRSTRPAVMVLFAGTNNVDTDLGEIVDYIENIVNEASEKSINTQIILPLLLPRGQQHNILRERNEKVNRLIEKRFSLMKNIHIVNTNGQKLIDDSGNISHLLMHDYLHLTEGGYELTWIPVFEKITSLLSLS